MKVLATQLLEMSQPQTDDRTPWWPLPAPTGQSSRTTTSWLWCMWGSHSMWTYLQNSTLEINDKYARASLFAWKKHGTGNEELQPVWPPNNGLQPEPIQSLGAGFPLQEHFLSNTHMHMFTQTKAFPALCSGWAIIVCLVQLHLKWQRPRAMGGGGGIRDCVQSNTRHSSCQRGCTALPFSPAPPHSPISLFMSARRKKKKSSLPSCLT